jgi:hypothetical protein
VNPMVRRSSTMLLRLTAVGAFALVALAPSFTLAQSGPAPATAPQRPTQAQVQAAMAAANLNLRQKRKLKPMVDTYKSQVASAPDEQTKTNATQQLIASMKTVLSPDQQAAFKQALTNQMSAPH